MRGFDTKNILVIGAAESCLGMIKAIQRKGHRALVVGTNAEQPGFEIADASLVCEDGDVDEVVKFGLEHMAAGIVPTPVDRTLAWQAEVAQRLSLIFIPAEKIPNFRHKYTQKLALVKAGIPCAKGILFNRNEICSFATDNEKPFSPHPGLDPGSPFIVGDSCFRRNEGKRLNGVIGDSCFRRNEGRRVNDVLGDSCFRRNEGRRVNDVLGDSCFRRNEETGTFQVIHGQSWGLAARQIGYPLVCKPIDGYASRGVYKCDNAIELESFIREASGFSSDGSVILEEYLEGREFNAEGVCYQGKPYVCAIVEKISDPFPYTVEMGHIIPAAITPEEKSELTDLADQAAIALGLENGAFNIELKLVDGKARIVEVNGRLAGDFIISHLLKPCTGIDMEEAVVDIALGRKPKLGLPGFQKHGIIRFFNLPAGKRIIEVPDLSRTMQRHGVIWAKSFYGKGDLVPEVTHMGQRSGFVIVVAESREEMFLLLDEAMKEIVNGFELT